MPAIKPFFALAFPITPALYKRIAAAHAADARKKVRAGRNTCLLRHPVCWSRPSPHAAAPLLQVLLLRPQPLSYAFALTPAGVIASAARGSSPLRIAYLSSDFGDHPVGHQGWFDHHRREQVLLGPVPQRAGPKSLNP